MPKNLKTEKRNAVEKSIQKPNKATPKIENNRNTPPEKEIIVQTPPRQLQADNNLRKENGLDENGVLRVPIREKNSDFPREKNTRRNIKMRGKTLPEMKKLYVEITSDGILGKQISEQIAAELQKSNLLSIVPNKEEADGRLIIYIRHESDGDEPEDKSVTAIVRLVNAEGFVVFNEKASQMSRLLTTKADEEKITNAKTEYEKAEAELQEIEAEIRKTSPRYAALSQAQTVSAEEASQSFRQRHNFDRIFFGRKCKFCVGCNK